MPVIPFAVEDACLDRYAQPDKGWTDRGEDHWPVPFWYADTGMAVLLILQTAVDEGLGAVYFGIGAEDVDAVREAFGVPADHEPIGGRRDRARRRGGRVPRRVAEHPRAQAVRRVRPLRTVARAAHAVTGPPVARPSSSAWMRAVSSGRSWAS